VSEPTLSRIQQVLDPGLLSANPLDAWGTGIDADAIFKESFAAFADDPETAAMAFVIDMTRQGEPYGEGYLQIARETWEGSDVPFCVLSNLASAVANDEATILRDAGIPVLEGTDSGLRALRHLLHDGERRRRVAVDPPAPVPDDVRSRWRARLAGGDPFTELDGLALLADYGVPTVDARAADTLEGALGAAESIGYPVALKTAVPGISHKSDVGGVRLSIARPVELRLAYEELRRGLGPQVVVAAMAPAGVEVALGVVRDQMFGSLVVVAAGGVLVELLKDRALGLPPLDEAHAKRLVDGLLIRKMLDGVRSARASDVASLVRAVSRISLLAEDLGDLLDALDVNPLIVGPSSCVAVDALVEPAASAVVRPG
jgi:acyl-CoA synthetase (NDP forming)